MFKANNDNNVSKVRDASHRQHSRRLEKKSLLVWYITAEDFATFHCSFLGLNFITNRPENRKPKGSVTAASETCAAVKQDNSTVLSSYLYV